MLVAGILLLMVECLCRLKAPPDPLVPPPDASPMGIMLKGNPWLLWELSPGRHQEMGVTVNVNPRGMRDRERGPKTRPRALILGDSSVYGFGVEDGEVFSAVLEKKVDTDFVNAAVPGYSSLQSLNLLRMRGLVLEPDLLIVGNLWSDNNFDSFCDEELLASYTGWENSASARLKGVLEHSYLFRWMDWKLRVEPAALHARKVGWQLGGNVPKNGRRRVSLDRYIATLEAIAETMEGRVVFLELPNREDIQPYSNPAWGSYRLAMEAMAQRWGAPLVDGPGAFKAAGRSADALFLDQMHPTVQGHQILAEAVQKKLEERHWPAEAWASARPQGSLPSIPDNSAQGVRTFSTTLHGSFQAPQAEGRWIVEVATPEQRGHDALGFAPVTPPSEWRLQLPQVPATVMIRVYLDRTGDGPGPGDPAWTLGPFGVPPDGVLPLDVRGRETDPNSGRL